MFLCDKKNSYLLCRLEVIYLVWSEKMGGNLFMIQRRRQIGAKSVNSRIIAGLI